MATSAIPARSSEPMAAHAATPSSTIEGHPSDPDPDAETGTGDSGTTPPTNDPQPIPGPIPDPDPDPQPVPAPVPAPDPGVPDPGGTAPEQPPAHPDDPPTAPAPTPPSTDRPTPHPSDPPTSHPKPAHPTGTPTLDSLSTSAAAALPTDDLIGRSHATVDQALRAGATSGGGAAGASIVMRLLQSALHRDENGQTVYDAKEMSLVEERKRLEAELRRRGSATDLVQRLLSNIIEQGRVRRERDKVEGLLALVVSICFGNIPKGLINRLVELGFGPEVERVMRDAIGNGRHLSRGAIRDLMSLAASGLGIGGPSMPDVGAAPEHQVEDYYRDEDRRIARNATATGGARMIDPRRVSADEQPSALTQALRARAVDTGWGSPASTA